MADSIINLKLLLIPHLKVINNSCFWSHVKVKFFLVLIYRRKMYENSDAVHKIGPIFYGPYYVAHIIFHVTNVTLSRIDFESTTKVPPSRIELFNEIWMFISPVFDIKCPPVCPVSWTTWILHHVIRIMSSNNSVFIQRIFLSASIPTYGSTNIKCI